MKRVYALMIVLALISGLSACSTSIASGKEAGTNISAGGKLTGQAQKVKLTLYDSDDDTTLTNAILSAYNAQSDSTEVEVQYIISKDYDASIRTLLHSGAENLDCLYIRQPCQSNQFAADNLLLDITDYIATTDLDVAEYGPTLDIVSVNEKLYSLPRAKAAWLLFYNKTIFAENGLEFPKQLTWDEYADLAKRLTVQNSDGTTRYGSLIPTWTMNLGASAAGEYLTDDELPITKTYISLLNRLYNIDKSHPGIQEMSVNYLDLYKSFESGEFAMMINGDWTILLLRNGNKEKQEDFDWDIAPLPVFDSIEGGSTVGNCSYMAISSTTQYPDNAFDFISFFCGSQGAAIMAKQACLPAYFTEAAAEIYLKEAKKPGAKYFLESYVANEEGSNVFYGEMNTAFKEEATAYLSGDQSIETAFAKYYAKRKDLLGK